MAPKKAAQPEEKVRLGRPSNNLKMGIVGLPNVGKSTLFNVIAKVDLGKSANFPYATIEPEEARVPVPDDRFLWLCDVYKPKSQIPAFLTCIDIAGLTAGASTGAVSATPSCRTCVPWTASSRWSARLTTRTLCTSRAM